jgi:hypothetical protein
MAVHEAVSSPACPIAKITRVMAREWSLKRRTRQSTQGKSSYGKASCLPSFQPPILSDLPYPLGISHRSPILDTKYLLTKPKRRKGSRGSSVGITTGYRLDERRIRSSSAGMVNSFILFASSRLAVGPTQHHIQWVPGTLSPGLMPPGREADHSPPTSAEVEIIWISTSTHHAFPWHSPSFKRKEVSEG